MPKRLIICCDGTWNTAGQKFPTNVADFYTAIASTAVDGTAQERYYHRGVGTGRFDRLRGGAFGWGLSGIVKDAYRMVVDNYDAGDELFLVGFSRGAFTARSTAGLIRNTGILRRGERARVDEAYRMYRSDDGPDAPSAVEFRKRYAVSETTPIRFIGVWDTVGALGVPHLGLPGLRWFANWVNRRWAFHDVKLSSCVASAYQALAIDEARRPFAPAVWESQPHAVGQELQQVWFAGVHCDVGGGYQERGLADITMGWLKDRARHCGLAFSDDPAAPPSYDDLAMSEVHDSRTGMYRILPTYERPIGVRDPANESVASTVITRRNAGGYSPHALDAYLAGPHRVTAL